MTISVTMGRNSRPLAPVRLPSCPTLVVFTNTSKTLPDIWFGAVLNFKLILKITWGRVDMGRINFLRGVDLGAS